VTYTIETLTWDKIKDDHYLIMWMAHHAAKVAEMYGSWVKWQNFDIKTYAERQRIRLCRRDGDPVGVMLASIYPSVFDNSVLIYQQDLLYARPGTRAAKLLMDDFIDFGKGHAKHIISMIGANTNIKPKSLERLGFKKLEELYRIEV